VTSLPSDVPDRILLGSPDAVVVCDPAGWIRLWNRGAERIFGFSRSEAVNASLEIIIPARLRARHWAGWKTAMSSGQTRYAEGQMLAVPALRKDGTEISIEFSIQLLEDANGRVEWVVAIVRDATERYARDKALRAELAALRGAG
jgi:PAS domain S-box-containing protein